MKKQVGILVFMLVAAQMAFSATVSENTRRIETENRVSAAKVAVRTAAERGQLEQDSTVRRLVTVVNGDLGKLSKAIVKQPELVRTLDFIDSVQSKPSERTDLERRAADAGKDFMGNYGVSKNLTKEGQADAIAESKAVQRFAEIISYLPSFGEKAVRVLEAASEGVTKKGLSMNKALRNAAVEVLGLKGKEIETFMKDPNEGLGNCKL